jgi:hypothetical protein
MRNALAHAPAKQRTAVAAMLKTIFAQESKAEAEAQWDTVADALREKQDKLGTFMDASRDDVLAYMDFPREHWTQIASTNPLERVNREIKRRTDVVGIFPNDDAIIRLVGAIMLVTLRRRPSDGAMDAMVSPTLWSTLRSHRTSRSCPPRTCRGVGTGAMRTRSGWSRKATGDIARFLRPPVGTAFPAGY